MGTTLCTVKGEFIKSNDKKHSILCIDNLNIVHYEPWKMYSISVIIPDDTVPDDFPIIDENDITKTYFIFKCNELYFSNYCSFNFVIYDSKNTFVSTIPSKDIIMYPKSGIVLNAETNSDWTIVKEKSNSPFISTFRECYCNKDNKYHLDVISNVKVNDLYFTQYNYNNGDTISVPDELSGKTFNTTIENYESNCTYLSLSENVYDNRTPNVYSIISYNKQEQTKTSQMQSNILITTTGSNTYLKCYEVPFQFDNRNKVINLTKDDANNYHYFTADYNNKIVTLVESDYNKVTGNEFELKWHQVNFKLYQKLFDMNTVKDKTVLSKDQLSTYNEITTTEFFDISKAYDGSQIQIDGTGIIPVFQPYSTYINNKYEPNYIEAETDTSRTRYVFKTPIYYRNTSTNKNERVTYEFNFKVWETELKDIKPRSHESIVIFANGIVIDENVIAEFEIPVYIYLNSTIDIRGALKAPYLIINDRIHEYCEIDDNELIGTSTINKSMISHEEEVH